MKKIVPILLAMVLALTLCLVGFADAERYDDDPLEETAVPTSEAVLEEAEPVPARSSECAKCGEMRVYIQKIGEYEAGPDQEPCIHKTAGTDAVYYKYCIYQEVCRGCGYKSPAWDVRSGETSRECHGWSTVPRSR